MTILVTGAAGFIGSSLCEELVAEGHNVIGLDNFDPFYAASIKQDNLRELLKNELFQFVQADLRHETAFDGVNGKPDVIVHLAAKAGVRPSIDAPAEYIDVNLHGTLNVLKYMLRQGIRKIVFASSSSVYGDTSVSPYKETENTDFPISPYAFTKKSGELMLYTYHNLYKIDSVSLRFFTVFGPRQRPDLAIHKFFNWIMQGKPITMYGDGSTSRDYTYISDIVSGIKAAIRYVVENERVYEIVNLGNNAPTPLKHLIESIETVIGKKAVINVEPMQPGDVLHTCANTDKAASLLGYAPKFNMQEGLRLFYEWKKRVQ